MSWKQDQEWESGWWGSCCNTFQEEQKQIVYAKKMGIPILSEYGHYPIYDLKGKILDIGGGPVSMLLKCKNVKGIVVDPCGYPNWVLKRYEECGIKFIQQPAEEFTTDKVYDMCLIYNVLQHTMDPEKIVKNMRSFSKVIRVFEWINEPISVGHPQLLTNEKLNSWFGGQGKVEHLNESGCHGASWSGIFMGDHYEK